MTTRGVRPGIPTKPQAGAARQGPGLLLPDSLVPAPAFSRERIRCHGEICYWCDQPIYGLGERLVCLGVSTHAHRPCAPDALLVLA